MKIKYLIQIKTEKYVPKTLGIKAKKSIKRGHIMIMIHPLCFVMIVTSRLYIALRVTLR